MENNYEFSQEQNELILKLQRMMRNVGIIFITLGAFTSIASISSIDIMSIAYGAAMIVIGYSLIQSAISFKKIAETEGSDIENLMAALRQLLNANAVQFWSLVIVFTLSIVFSFLI